MKPRSGDSTSRLMDNASRPGSLASLGTTLLLALILVTGPLVLGGARLWIQLPILVGVAFLLLIQGMRLVLRPPTGARADAIDLTVALFVLYTIGRWLTSPSEYFSRMEMLNIVGYAGIFYTCRYGLTRRRHGVLLLGALVLLGAFETGFGYYFWQHSNADNLKAAWFPFGENERLHLYYYPRWLGTYGCPNHYGGLLVMATGAALAMACFSRLAWPVRIVLFYLAGMMLVGVMLSASRGTYIAGVVSIIALLVFGLRHGTVRWWVPVLSTIVLLTAVAVLFSTSHVVRERLAEANTTLRSGNLNTYVRVQLAEDALRIAKDHPLFGTGPGTFIFVHPRYQSDTFAFKAQLTHNDYLNCLDDYGVIGFGLAMLFVVLVTLRFFRLLPVDSRWQDRVVIAAGFAAWAALLVHSLLDFNLHIPANALLLFALTGLALGRLSVDVRARHWTLLPLAQLGQGLGWAVMVLSVVFGLEAARSAASDIVYEQAHDRALVVPISESIKQAQEALRYDPANAQALLFLGDLYRANATMEPGIEGRVQEGQKALGYYQAALKANVYDDSIQARLGRTFDIMRRYSEAFFCYQAAATAQPNNGEFWFWLGNHYWQRGMLSKALESYQRAQKCPYGARDSEAAAKEILALPQMQGRELPDASANPLAPAPPEEEHPETTP